MLPTAGSRTSAKLKDIFGQVADLRTIDFGQCGDALEFIMEANPEEEYAEFPDVYHPVYSTVTNIIDSIWIWIPSRPSAIHEAPLEHFSTIFTFFLHGLRHRDNPVHTRISMNSPLSFAVPDMVIQMHAATDNYWSHDVLVFVECAFAQDTGSVLRKIKYEIAVHPEVLMVILVVIDEDQRYRSPERTSEAWRMLRQEISPHSESSFYSLQEDTHQSHDKPIVIAGHTWCHLASARFHIWLRGDEPINLDIDVDNNELQACGTLFPNQDIDAVDAMIKKGMVMMRDRIATVCQEAAPGSNITALQNSVIMFRPDWDDLLIGLKRGVWDIAYGRYRSWYDSAP